VVDDRGAPTTKRLNKEDGAIVRVRRGETPALEREQQALARVAPLPLCGQQAGLKASANGLRCALAYHSEGRPGLTATPTICDRSCSPGGRGATRGRSPSRAWVGEHGCQIRRPTLWRSRRGHCQLEGGKSRIGPSILNREQPPRAGHTFEFMFASVHELDA
jgi:hypothetical protein